jgi:hypothetical protein
VTFHDVYDALRAYGYPLRGLPFDDWFHRLAEEVRSGADNALAPFASLAEGPEHPDEPAPEGTHHQEIRFDGTNTQASLAGTGITCPELDQTLLTTYFNHLVSTGFLPPPPNPKAVPEPGGGA